MDSIKIQNNISHICKYSYNYFFNKQNVLGIALGYKRQHGFYTCDLCINVFVIKKISKSKLSSNDIIPPYFKGIKTDVIESGIIKAASLTQKIRPVIGGYCISPNIRNDTIGTAGCLVTNGVSNFVLSANHVLTNINLLPLGTHIIQPSYSFSGQIDIDSIGLLTPQNIMKPEIAFIGKLNCVKKPILNATVQKVGSVTELTQGTITNINGTVIAAYPNGKSALFKECIFTTRMNDVGDSGAILVNKNMCAIGMLFTSTDNFSMYNRIDIILDQLDVKLVN